MLGSMTPLGERARDRRWRTTVAWYVIGSALGGAAIGLLAAFAGRLLRIETVSEDSRIGILVLALVIGLSLDLSVGGMTLPTLHRQVRKEWLTDYRQWVYAAGFGVQLGVGVVTVVNVSAVYIWLIAAALTAAPVAGLGLGAAFGIARGLPILSVRNIKHPNELATLVQKLDTSQRISRWSALTMEGVVALVLSTAVISGLPGL